MTKTDTADGDQRTFRDHAISFLTEILGFDSGRVNQRVITSVADALEDDETTPADRQAAIIAAVTVGESFFLRHPHHFEWIVDRWARRRLRGSDALPTRILSAGCASGEEPYSICAMLRRAMPLRHRAIQIEAFDVNDRFLHRARRARYRPWSLRRIDLEDHRDWLELDESHIRVCEPVRRPVDFTCHNLLDPLEANAQLTGIYDLILCRNVLLYFHDRAIRTAYRHLADVLHRDGALIIGPSDPAPPDELDLTLDWEDGLRVVRRTDTSISGPSTSRRDVPAPADEPDSDPRQPPAPQARSKLADETTSSRTECSGRRPGTDSDETFATPVDSEDVCRVARRLGRMASTELAVQFLATHLRDHPLDVEAHVLGAEFAAEIEDFDQAFRWARRATFLAPDAPYPVYLLAEICARSGREGMVSRYMNWARELLEDRPPDDRLKYSDDSTVAQLREVIDGTT